jgi:hypothetical protein
MVLFLFSVLCRGLGRALSRTPREVPAAAALHVLITMLMRVPMERQFRDAGSTALSEVLTSVTCEAMAEALA